MDPARRTVLVAGLCLAPVVTLAATTRRAKRATDRLVTDLLAAAETTPRSADDELDGLPAPVRRYFEAVLPAESTHVRTVRLDQRGAFRLGDRWRPFTATQRFTVDPPGFVWAAEIEVAPRLNARVVDAYHDGGVLRATVLGVPVATAGSTPETDEAELVRYLAEAVWFPTALLPSAGVEWVAVDERRARARLPRGRTTATLTFEFGDGGLVERVHTERYRQEDDTYAPWNGRFWEYERYGGLLVPTEAEVGWDTPDGHTPYWRGSVTALEYDPIRVAVPGR